MPRRIRNARPRHDEAGMVRLAGLIRPDPLPLPVIDRCGICDRTRFALPAWAIYEPDVACCSGTR